MTEASSERKLADHMRGAAFHEAGHAVVARHLGLRVGEIMIGIDDDPAKGGAEIEIADKLPLIEQLAVCAAGMEAQEMFDAPTHGVAGFGDAVSMYNLLVDEADAESIRKAGEACAREMLKIHKAEVEELAQRLLHDRRVTSWPENRQ